MKHGKGSLLKGVLVGSCLSLLAAGCATVPEPETTELASVTTSEAQPAEVEAEQENSDESPRTVIQQAQPLINKAQPRRPTAEQQRLAQLRKQRQQQWEQTQQLAQQRQTLAAQQPAKPIRPRPTPQRPAPTVQDKQPITVSYGGKGIGSYHATQLTGDFAGDPRLLYFIDAVSRRHGFDRNYLLGVFSRVRNRDEVARLWAGNSGGSATPGGWYAYRAKFVTPENTRRGSQFWQQYEPHLLRAQRQFGVDPEYIVGIMGVETRWGRILGKHKIIDALTTSALVNQRRSNFFFTELENYLLMTRSERMDPLAPMGSYAGAMGYGQFMPSSFHAYAVDFNGDGVRDLWNPVDAIGSIANYFARHGWRQGQEVAVPASVNSNHYASMPDGFKVKYTPANLSQNGIAPQHGRWSNTERTHLLALTTIPGGIKEPWIGYQNFYVITRYNKSNYYAMAVHQLAQTVKNNKNSLNYASR